jgi:sensor histidine kinase YesM
VENVFKHGIDKNSHGNSVDITLAVRDGYLYFQTANHIPPVLTAGRSNGFGIRNLAERLRILYGSDFELNTGPLDGRFVASLKFPLK